MVTNTVDSSDWELPTYKVINFFKKKNKYALIIPVINEGQRIKKQLQRINQMNCPIDIIIADGGSTDGSLNSSYMRELNVNTVLTKTGPGKLSAQLRMAYAWCLKESYCGVVTIDGNGKDGVEAVINMLEMLAKGYDYVQGSRYLQGGKAENTPITRTLANRCIHAPLLSLAGKNWYTDTTNGFRAYSANFLLDPRVRPFRDVFQNYELLFYLTVRAGQIGMQIAQVPVNRRYPKEGSIPTKIIGFRANFNILKQTFLAAVGNFNP